MLPIGGGWLTGVTPGLVGLQLGPLSPGAVVVAVLAVSLLGLIASTLQWRPRRTASMQPLRMVQRPLNCR